LASRLPSSSDEPQASESVGFGRRRNEASSPEGFLNPSDLGRQTNRRKAATWRAGSPSASKPGPFPDRPDSRSEPGSVATDGWLLEASPEVAPCGLSFSQSPVRVKLRSPRSRLHVRSLRRSLEPLRQLRLTLGSRSDVLGRTGPLRRPTRKRPGPSHPPGRDTRSPVWSSDGQTLADLTLRGPPLTGMPLSVRLKTESAFLREPELPGPRTPRGVGPTEPGDVSTDALSRAPASAHQTCGFGLATSLSSLTVPEFSRLNANCFRTVGPRGTNGSGLRPG